MSLRETVASYFTASTAHAEESATDTDDEACLFECPNCDVTYVSEEMSDCPNCSATVTGVPTAKDLGMA